LTCFAGSRPPAAAADLVLAAAGASRLQAAIDFMLVAVGASRLQAAEDLMLMAEGASRLPKAVDLMLIAVGASRLQAEEGLMFIAVGASGLSPPAQRGESRKPLCGLARSLGEKSVSLEGLRVRGCKYEEDASEESHFSGTSACLASF